MWCIILCVVVTSLACGHVCERSVSVVSNVGTVRGRVCEFNAFLGIPYGRVDDDDPFAAAKPYPHFDIPYSAYKDPPVCPQIVDGVPQGSIHCLNLNVYTPINAKPNSTLPVMVFTHGGAFIEGNGNLKTMSPIHLINNNVIVVTVNYRLGPYGFLCLPHLGYSNQGLKDIVLAMKWVKDNINSFGGDEDNILLFGHSAGSGAAEFLLLYNKDNVFNKVILQSMNIVSPYMPGDNADEDFVATVAEKLAIDSKQLRTDDIMKQLSKANTHSLINSTRGRAFRPCVDDIFITKSPKLSNIDDKRIIIGSTSKEMLFFYKAEASYLNKIKEELDMGFSDLSEDAVTTVKNFYSSGNVKNDVIDFGVDFAFNYPADRSVRYYIANNATVYRYVFSHDGGHNYMKLRENITEAGATHGDELGYLFDMDTLQFPYNYEDAAVSATMAEMWTNFAKFGNPTPKLSTHIHQYWPPVEKDTKKYINISYAANFVVQEGPYHDRMSFWDEFYQMYGNKSKGFNFGEEYKKHKKYKSGLTKQVMGKIREFK